MSMMDLYNDEVAQEALEEALETKAAFVEKVEELDCMIFILKYFLKTGDPLDPAAFGIEDPEGEDKND